MHSTPQVVLRKKTALAHLSLRPRLFGCIVLAAVIWGAGICWGTRALWRYDLTPGGVATSGATWPSGTSLQRDANRATLVMIVHPNCPCSRASISEFEVLMSRCQDQVTAYVLFERLAGVIDDPATTDLWKTAARIPGVTVVSDTTGEWSKQFHAETSGQTLLYDRSGSLRFNGGITPSRGHAGESDGRIAIELIINGAVPAHDTTPVYGCSLR